MRLELFYSRELDSFFVAIPGKPPMRADYLTGFALA